MSGLDKPIADAAEAETLGRAGVAVLTSRSAAGRAFGEYELLAEIARGGMGVVYKARQRRLNRTVAVKMILTGQLADQDEVRRFLTEAEAAAGLDHPGIVPVYESGEIDGQHFFSMGFVDGQSLAALLTQGPLPPQQAADLVAQVADAVDYAHERGVIHRDLKPGNILLDKQSHPRVTDFGLAKRITGDSGLTRSGQALGTPSFMPPEQASGKLDAIGPAADVYALGAVLYAALTGRPPFQAATPLDTILQVLEQDPVAPRQLNAGIPRDLETIALKCLEKEPHKRYSTAHELADELRRFLRGEPIHARPVRRAERVWRWCRRNPAIAALTAAVAATLIAGTVVSSYFAIEANQRAVAESNAKLDALKQKTIADKNAKRANENARRADKNAAEAQEYAKVAKANAEKESRARLAAERQLRIATAERLAVMSHSKRSELPQVSLLLAVESGQATRHSEEGLLPNSHQTLFDALAAIGGRSLVGHQTEIHAVAVSPDGRWIVTASGDRTARLWDLLADDPAARPRVLRGHDNGLTNMAISADSRWLVTGSKDHTARVWDLWADGPAASLVLKGPSDASVAISRDSRWVVTGGNDNAACLWDLSAKDPSAQPRLLSGHQRVRGVAISPDGHWVATGGDDKTARLWDVWAEDPSAHPRVLGGHKWLVQWVAITPDGHWLLTGSRDTIRVWDLAAADPAANPRVLSGHSGNIYCMAIGANSRWVVTGGTDTTARVWDLAAENPSANPRVLAGHERRVECAAISPDARWIVTGSEDYTARVWDLAASDPSANPRVLVGHQGSITCLAIGPDSRWLVTGSSDSVARLWDLVSESPAANPCILAAQGDQVASVAISPDSRWLVTGGRDATARVWDLDAKDPASSSRVFRGHAGPVNAVAVSLGGRSLVTGGLDKTARLWDLGADDPGANPRVLAPHPMPVGSVAVSPDGRWAATGTIDAMLSVQRGENAVRLWDLAAENPNAGPRLLSGHHGSVRSAAISANGRWLVTGSDDLSVLVWDLNDHDPGAKPRVIKSSADFNGFATVMGVAISGDGGRVVACLAGDAQVWDLKAKDSPAQPLMLRGHRGPVMAVTISPDGRWVVTGGFDTTTRIWDLAAANPSDDPLILRSHRGAVNGVAISGDGRWIATASEDKKVRLWRWQWDDLVSLAAQSGRNFEKHEWAQYFPNEPYRKTFPEVPASYMDDAAALVEAFESSNERVFARVYDALDEQLAGNDGRSKATAERFMARRQAIVSDPVAAALLEEAAKKNVNSAARLLLQIARARTKVRSSPNSHVVVGEVIVADGKTDAELVQAQMPVLPGGYFAGEVADLAKPLCFRAQGYQGVDLVLDPKRGELVSAGQVRLRPLSKAEQATLHGTVQLDMEGSPTDARVQVYLRPGPPNATDNRSSGSRRVPEPVLATVNQEGVFVADGLSPGEYNVQVSAAGHADLARDASLKSGESVDLGHCRLFASDVAKYIGKSAPGSKELVWERSFSTAAQRARQEKKPLMVLVTAPWLGRPKQLEEQTFNDPWVRRFLSPFVVVKSFDDPEVKAKYGPSGHPTVFFTDSDGKQVHTSSGFKASLAFCADCAQAIDALQLAMPPELEQLIDKRFIDFKPSAPRPAPQVAAPPREVIERALESQLAARQWSAVGASLKQLADDNPDDHFPWFRLAVVSIFLDDEKTLRETTKEIEKRFAAMSDPFVGERFTKAFALARATLPDLTIAEAWLQSVRADHAAGILEFWNPLAAALVDLGQNEPATALACLQRAEAADPGLDVLKASCQFTRSLALLAEGNRDLAQDAYARGLLVYWTQLPHLSSQPMYPKDFFQEYLVACVLCRRAEQRLFEREQTEIERYRRLLATRAAGSDNAAWSLRHPNEVVKPTEAVETWLMYVNPDAKSTVRTADGTIVFQVDSGGGAEWHVQAFQHGLDFKEGAEYVVRFKARGDKARSVMLRAGIDHDDFHSIGLEENISVTEDFRAFELKFRAHDVAAYQNRFGFMLGGENGAVYIKNVSLVETAFDAERPTANAPHEVLKPTAAASSWALNVSPHAKASLGSDDGMMRFTADSTDGLDRRVEAYQTGLDLREGHEYVVRFQARGDKPRSATLVAEIDHDDFHSIGLTEKISVTEEFRSFEFKFSARHVDLNRNRCGFLLGGERGSLFVKDMSLIETAFDTAGRTNGDSQP